MPPTNENAQNSKPRPPTANAKWEKNERKKKLLATQRWLTTPHPLHTSRLLVQGVANT